MVKNTLAKQGPATTLLALADENPKFALRYTEQLQEVSEDLPTPRDLQTLIDDLPEELRSKVMSIAVKMSGKRKGQYGEKDFNALTELKLYHGTGRDPNRPDKQIPGELYLTTKTSVGNNFRGAILATVNGRSKWSTENSSQPDCRSSDRKIGSNYGDCSNCIYAPWIQGQKPECNKDITVYMVPETLDDIIFCRFTKTSEATGRRLVNSVSNSMTNWIKWFDFSTVEEKQKGEGKNRYFKWEVEPASGEGAHTPEELDAFFSALCTLVEATYILPQIAFIYKQAEDSDGPATEDTGAGSQPVEDDDYTAVPAAPTDDVDM